MQRLTIFKYLLCLLCFVTSTALAARSYHIEALVFLKNNTEPVEQNYSNDLPAATESDLSTYFTDRKLPFTVIPPSEYALQQAAEKLTTSGEYTILWHQAWLVPKIASFDKYNIPINAEVGNNTLRGSLHFERHKQFSAKANVRYYIPDDTNADAVYQVIPFKQQQAIKYNQLTYLQELPLGMLIKIVPTE